MSAWEITNDFLFPDNSHYIDELDCGDNWSLVTTNGENNFLIAKSQLVEFWTKKTKLLPYDLFIQQQIGDTELFLLASRKPFVMGEVGSFYQYNPIDALAFACAMKASREILVDIQFSQAIYIEQYCRILPIGEIIYDSEKVLISDGYILGKYLSQEEILVNNFSKIKTSTPKISENEWRKICNTAGIDIKKLPNNNKQKKSSKFTLVGRKKLEDFFNEHIIDIIFNLDKYQKVGISYPSAVILHGQPGCGKTFAVEKLAEFLALPVFRIDSSNIASPYIHDTAKKISDIFDEAIENAPSILIIDEMEAYLSDRNSLNQQHSIEEMAEFLRRIPEATSKQVLIFAMTNLIEKIDPAILRRGRFDHIIEVEMPNQEEILHLLHNEMKNRKHDKDINFIEISEKLTNRPMSDIAFVIREAARLSVRNNKNKIDQESFNQAFLLLPNNNTNTKNKIGFLSSLNKEENE